jgi:hypothetical protein
MPAPIKDQPSPAGGETLLHDAAARAERLASSLAAHVEGLPPAGLAALAQVSGAVERLRGALNDAMSRATGESHP